MTKHKDPDSPSGRQNPKPPSVGGNYVPPVHDLLARPPFRFEQVTTIALRLSADNDALRAMTDKYLNAPLNGAPRFSPSGSGQMVLVISHFPASYGHGQPGLVDYKEVALMFVVEEEGVDPIRQSLFSPLLILDGARMSGDWLASFPIAIGREYYGLPKVRGEISFNARHNLPDEDVGIYSASVELSAKTAHKMPISLQQFLIVEPDKRPSLADEIELRDRELAERIRKIYGMGEDAPDHLIRSDKPLIGLSQLVDPANTGKTLAAAVVRTPFELQGSESLLASDVTVRFNTQDHGELIKTLGLDDKYELPRDHGLVRRHARGEFGGPSGTTVWPVSN